MLEQHGVEDGRPLTPDDLHNLHSTTKTFTGTLVGLAIADGRLSLDTCANNATCAVLAYTVKTQSVRDASVQLAACATRPTRR